jgi:hypothetical protein
MGVRAFCLRSPACKTLERRDGPRRYSFVPGSGVGASSMCVS